MSELMSVRELAQKLGVSELSVYRWAADGKIPRLKVGRVLRFDPAAIDTWLSGLMQPVVTGRR